MSRTNAGYTITDSIFIGKAEFVIGYNPSFPAPYVTWECKDGNAPEYFENGIPESVIDAYVEKIVVFEDHFEWYLRFGGNDSLKCRVNGKKDANSEVIFGDSPSSLTELEKHRLLLKSRETSNCSCPRTLPFIPISLKRDKIV